MRRARWLVAASAFLLSAACSSGSTAPSPTNASTARPTPSLRELAAGRHATFVAGPMRGPAGLFAAYSLVKSVSAVHDPGSALMILRWDGARWEADGRLGADHYRGFWDFPSNNLDSALVDRASSEAPVFDGVEGGAGSYALMVAVRQGHRWFWARFRGCQAPNQCPPQSTRSNTATNGRIDGGRLVGDVGNCEPNCAQSTVIYRNEFSWVATARAFVLTGQRAVRR